MCVYCFFRASVVLTDLSEYVPLLEQNIKSNSALCKGEICAQQLKWGTPVTDPKLLSPDFILVSDCVYYEEVSTSPFLLLRVSV